MSLHTFGENLWIAPQPLRFYGLEVGTCMSVIDLDGRGSLLVHSPSRLTPEIQAQLTTRGEVKFVVAPNKMHHLFLADFRQIYPWAQFFCSPGLEKKCADFEFTAVLDDEQTFAWNPTLSHHVVKGSPFYNETVFFHGPSKTLLLTDLAVHICHSSSLWTRIFLKALGSYKKFGWSPLEKRIFIKDKTSFNASLDHILTWPFEKIIMAHGDPILTNAKTQFEKLKS